jgi:hypothetical protein
MTSHVKVSGAWRSVTNLYVKVGTTLGPFSNGWRTVSNGYVNSGGWRSFFTSAITPSIVSAVTISRNNAAYPSTLTGTNRFWTNSTSLTYVFQKSSDNTNWSDIGSSAVITNPSSGSTNTKTYVLTTADMPAYTSYYRFSVTATNSTYSTTTTSNSTSVTVTQPAPVNTVAPVVTPSTGTPGVTTYSTTNGTWGIDDADGIYAYQWQSLSGSLQTITGATSSTYSPPSNYVSLYGTDLRCRVTATNTTGSTAATSNPVTVGVPIPTGGTITLTPSGTQYSGTLLTATTSGWSGSPTSYSVRIYGSTFNPPDTSNVVKTSSSTASATYTITNGDASPPALYFKAFATATNASGTSVEIESNVVTSKLPSASALAIADTTITPGAPSSITVTNTATTNQGQVSWTNGSNASTAWVSTVTPGSSFTGTDGGSLPTSQTFTITSSANAVATVNNKNLQKKATVSWTQDGALSYSANVTISGSSFPVNGTSNITGSTSGSSGSFDVNLSTGGGTVRVNSITVYTKASQTGGSFTFTPATAPSITPTDKTSTATGSGSVTFTPPAPVNTVTPTITPTSGRAGTTTYSVNNNGTWNNVDLNTVFTYQWQSFDQGSVYINISGATSSSYSPPSDFFSSKISPIRCRVTATNAGGSATASSNTATVTPITAPGQVTGVTATATTTNRPYNNGEIGVSWTAPADNGGSAITGYYVEYSSNGGSSWSIFTSNWTSGTGFGSSPWGVGTYIFRVSAINAVGTGTASANSNNAVVTTVPQAPTIGTATAGNGTVSVAFTAGATGGSAITGFTVTSSSGNTGTGASSPISVSDVNGTARTYTVTATNANGTSVASSASNSATPTAPVSVPAGGTVSISTNTGNYTVGSIITYSTTGWSGSPTSYSLRLYNGTNPVLTSDPLRASTTSTSATYTIASGDVPNYFKAFATAINSGGTSTEASSLQVGPAVAAPANTVPGTVNSLSATSSLSGSNLNWSASWSAPSSNGGAAIDGYRVYVERAGSSTGPWIAATTQIPAGSGAYTAGSPAFTISTSVSGRVTGTSSTWIRVWVAAVNTVGTGTYTNAVG